MGFLVNFKNNMTKKINYKEELDKSLELLNTDKIPTIRINIWNEVAEFWHSLQDKHTYLCKWYWKDYWYEVRCFFFPKTKWIRKAVDNRWHDLDYCFEKLLYAGIVNYVEGERCFETVMWTSPNERKHKKKIEEIYKWAKTGRNELQLKIDAAYPPHEDNWMANLNKRTQPECKADYERIYGEVNRLEKLLYDTDTKHLTWLISNRNVLWT